MATITRTYETDLDDLAYQLSKSDKLAEIREEFSRKEIDDQEAQSMVLDLVEAGRTRIQGDRGEEEITWKLSEAESGRLSSVLYRNYLGGA